MPPKRKRPDVAKRKAHATTLRNTVVKLTWNSFCKDSARHIPIHAVVRRLSQIVAEARCLANAHVLRLLTSISVRRGERTALQGRFLQPLGQEFFYQCCAAVGTSGADLQDPHLAESFRLYKSWLPATHQPADTSYLAAGALNNISLSLYTEFRNHLSTNFFSKFKQFVQAKHDFSGPEATRFVQRVYTYTPGSQHARSEPLIGFYHSKLPDVPSKRNIWTHPVVWLPLFHTFQLFVEEHPDAGRQKAFSLLPHKDGFKACHFKMKKKTASFCNCVAAFG